jgi:hypothetical protein
LLHYLTNFKLDWQTIDLFRAIFTPEDCFSLQFSFSLTIFSNDYTEELSHNPIFSFVQNLAAKEYLNASVRSLKIFSHFINDEQLHFIFSHLNRITKLEFLLDYNDSVTSEGFINSIGENLSDLTELKISSTGAINASTLQRFASKFTKLTILELNSCGEVADDSLLEISKMKALTSLQILDCEKISSIGYSFLASMTTSMLELTVASARAFNDECAASRAGAQHLRSRDCGVSSEGLRHLTSLLDLSSLNLSSNEISDEHICCLNLNSLTELLTFPEKNDTDILVKKKMIPISIMPIKQ